MYYWFLCKYISWWYLIIDFHLHLQILALKGVSSAFSVNSVEDVVDRLTWHWKMVLHHGKTLKNDGLSIRTVVFEGGFSLKHMGVDKWWLNHDFITNRDFTVNKSESQMWIFQPLMSSTSTQHVLTSALKHPGILVESDDVRRGWALLVSASGDLFWHPRGSAKVQSHCTWREATPALQGFHQGDPAVSRYPLANQQFDLENHPF